MSNFTAAIDHDLAESVSGTHRHALEKVFQHPLSHNLSWPEVTRLFGAIGEVEHQHNGELVLRVGHERLALAPSQDKDLDATQIMDVRHLLIRAGWSTSHDGVAAPAAPSMHDSMIVIDHAGARLFALPPESEARPHVAVGETHHLLHRHISRKQHDADREENHPADVRFFEAIAHSLPSNGRIVVIGHGKGQSNEEAHLISYLRTHNNAIYGRIAKTIAVDISKMTVPQMLQLSCEALKPKSKPSPTDETIPQQV